MNPCPKLQLSNEQLIKYVSVNMDEYAKYRRNRKTKKDSLPTKKLPAAVSILEFNPAAIMDE